MKKGAKRLLAWLLCGLGKRGYQRARARLPDADREIVAALDDLQAIERENARPWIARRTPRRA